MNIDLLSTMIALLTFFGIASIMALSLNLEYGVAGVPNFGHALFISIGAYTAGWTYTRLLPMLANQQFIHPCGSTLGQSLQLRTQILKTMPVIALTNFGLTLVIAALIGGVVGYLASYPALRLKEEWYLALVLLVGSEIVRIIVRSYEPIICASNGLSGIGQPFVWVSDRTLKSAFFAGVTLLLAFLCYLYSERLTRSPYGRMLKAMRENEHVATAVGKNVSRLRGQIMFVGSAMAAMAGVLFVTNLGFASANDYVVELTLDVWVMIVLGGLGNNRGAILGALIVTLLDRTTAIGAMQLDALGTQFEFSYTRFILFGLILLVMLRYRPQGLWPEPAPTTRAHKALIKAS